MSEVVENLEYRWYCPACKEGYEISPTDPDFGMLPLSMRCPQYDVCHHMLVKRGRKRANELKNQKVHKVKAKDLFLASQGFGTVGERRCSPTYLKKLMLQRFIIDVELEPVSVGVSRSIIKKLTLHTDKGPKVLHFATSGMGATIYKVTDG